MTPLFTSKPGSFKAHKKYLLSTLLFTSCLVQGFCDDDLSEELFDDASEEIADDSSDEFFDELAQVIAENDSEEFYDALADNSSEEGATMSSNNSSEEGAFFKSVAPLMEFKAGYFFFATSKMRKIYNQGGLDLQLSGTFPIWRGFQGYLSVEYLEKSGKLLNTHEKTSIWEIPVSLGLKPVFTICKQIQYYFTLGPRYFYVHQHNKSPYLPNNIGRSGLGMFVNTGFNFYPIEHFVIDIFGEYSYERVNISANKANNVYGENTQVGGFVFGGGLGYAF